MTRVNKNGFTLAELIIVLGVITIMWLAASLYADGLRRHTLNNASLALQADIRYAQQMAVMEGRVWRVDFDSVSNSYTIRRMPNNILDTADYYREVILPRGVTIDFNGTRGLFLHYTPKGTVHNAGTISLRSGSLLQRSTVVPSAGRVRVLEIISHSGGDF